MLVHGHMNLMRAKISRRMQYTVGHYEAVINVHHRMRGQMPDSIVFPLSKTFHAGKKLILRYEGVKPHGCGMIVRMTDSWIIKRINIINLPLGPVKVVRDRI